MSSFDFKKAWHECIAPEFLHIYPHIRTAYDLTELYSDKIEQVEGSAEVSGVPVEVLEEFRKLDLKTLAHAAVIVYYYGYYYAYYSPCGTAQKHGLYWKFKYIAEAVLLEKNASNLLPEAMHNLDKELDKYFINSIVDYYRELM